MKKKSSEKAFDVCPRCGHDWIAHFQMIEDDGTPEGKQIDPKPRPCMECEAPGCELAIERAKPEDNNMILEAMEPKTKPKKEDGPDPRQMSLF